MTLAIDQVNVTYIPEEDRIVIRFALNEDEIVLWMTRRCLEVFWPLLTNQLTHASSVVMQSSPMAKAMVLELEHEKSLQQSDRQTPYRYADSPTKVTNLQGLQGDGIKMLGGYVICQIRVPDIQTENMWSVSLLPAEGEGIALNMPMEFWHSLADLLKNASTAAHWCLDLSVVPSVLHDNELSNEFGVVLGRDKNYLH